MELEIRPMAMDDRDRVERFFAGLGASARAFFNRDGGNLQGARKFFDGTDAQDVRRWVAVENGEMVGYVFLWDVKTGIPWLGIATADCMRGRGLGGKLMNCAEAWCRAQNKAGILLTTHTANIHAQALYERCGFERLGFHFASGELLYLKRF